MGLKKFRPLTPSLRFTELDDFSDITTDKPYRPLTIARRKTGGRNNYGRITCRHIGGGHKQRIRVIDFKRDKHGIPAEVKTIEYDPIRTARIALVEYKDGEKRYIIAPNGLTVGQTIMSGPDCEPTVGNALPLEKIPLGTVIHNIEMIPGRGAQICRSAGSSATLMALDAGYANIRMPSGEIRKIHAKCYATIGQVSNIDHFNQSLGKAGRKRWLGIRPTVRGMAMNPVDHPNGGGQGKSKGGGGRQHLVSPWGQLAKGLKTRRKHKISDKFIVQDRRKK
ncbi:MAG: 50S ribosomal protein L2 [Methylacidiphilales bacterium]|nr:50S ribosomal protein L2 [Candidatus Methylacidiphilales bacterium]MDW8348986.1 50S ribosomal protein L2 [Verrucomicrobiae bacterium]